VGGAVGVEQELVGRGEVVICATLEVEVLPRGCQAQVANEVAGSVTESTGVGRRPGVALVVQDRDGQVGVVVQERTLRLAPPPTAHTSSITVSLACT
jgi:outer membrane lipoprotein SlyB